MWICRCLFEKFIVWFLICIVFVFGIDSRFRLCSKVDFFELDGLIRFMILFLCVVMLMFLRMFRLLKDLCRLIILIILFMFFFVV